MAVLSVLDLAPITEGSDAAQSLQPSAPCAAPTVVLIILLMTCKSC